MISGKKINYVTNLSQKGRGSPFFVCEIYRYLKSIGIMQVFHAILNPLLIIQEKKLKCINWLDLSVVRLEK